MTDPLPASAGSFALSPAELDLEPAELDPATILEGSPEVSELVVWESSDGRRSRGVWQITAGVVTDVEADELFVVLLGRATIEIEDGPTIEVGPGDLCVLEEGARTTWRVHETLRKVFSITSEH
ncbi:MAG: cupin domain-containing protein [Actinomycetota bacterium]